MKSCLRYGYAILAVPLAVILRFALLPLAGPGTPFITLFPVTVAVALLAGMGPAVLTGILGSIAFDYFFIPPLYAIDFDVPGISRMAVIILTSAFVGYVGDVLRAARAKAEQQAIELLESKDRLSTVFRASPTGVFITRLSDGLFLDANEAYLRIIRYSADEVIGHTSPELNIWVNSEDRKKIVDMLRESGRIDNREIKLRRKNGEIVDLLYSALPLERGGEPCILGTLTDISARKRAEDALRESEERYRTLFETMLEGFCIIEVVFDAENKPVDYRFLDINPAFEKQTELHNAKGKLMRELAPAHEAHWFEIYGKIALTGEPTRFENEAKALNRWFDVSAVRVGGPESRKVAILFNDISERKRAEEAIRKSRDELEKRVGERTAALDETVAELQQQMQQRIRAEKAVEAERKRFEDVLEMMPAYAILLTPDYHVAYANRTFREWFGDDNGQKCYEFLFNRKEPCKTCETYTVLKTNKPHHWEWTGPNGKNYDIYDYPFTDTDGSQLIMEMGIDITEQKRAQEALRSTSLYVRGLIEASIDPLVTISPDGKITDVNKATEQVTGVSRDVLVGSDFSDYFTEHQKAKEGYQKVLQEGTVRDYPLTIRNVSGRTTDVLYNATVYKDTRGNVIGVFAAARDVTVQKQASQYARSLIESSLDPLVTINAEGKITDVNDATIKVTGVSREQLIGTDFSNYFTEPIKAREGYKQVFARGFVTDYPLTIRHKDGRLTDVVYNASIYKDTYGNVIGVFAAARDVTEKKRVERRQGVTNSLLELYAKKTTRREYLDSAVEVIRNWSGCSRVGVRVKDDKRNIPYESCVGFEKDFLDLENPLHLDHDKCLCIRAILQQPIEHDKTLLTPGGSFYSNDSLAFVKGLTPQQAKDYRGNCMKHGFQSIAIVPIRYRDEVLGAIHIADSQKAMVPLMKAQFIETTISPLIGEAIHRFSAEAELDKYRLHLEELVKQRTEELARSNKDLEQFAYVASHDLQEPLRAISGFVGLLRYQLQSDLDAQKTEYMNFVVDGAARMQSLINGLLEYSRIDTRGKPPEPTDSKAALEQALLDLQISIRESNAKITAEDLPTVNIDPVQLVQLFQNLIGNAIKFRTELPPKIHVSAVHQDGCWRFAITDNGIGIDPQYAHRIFLIFQRLHTRKKYPGTGIGLSICKKIIERHGGKIWVESESGRGSIFYFTVPDIGET